MATGPTNGLVRHIRRAVLLPEDHELTDGQLLSRFLGHQDEAAFEALLRRHGPMVLGVCRRVLGHAHDAEDAFQATFLVLIRKAATIQPRGAVGNWLYGVAYRTALEARAAAARRRRNERQVADMARHRSPAGNLSGELREILDHELSRLPDTYRAAVVLCDLEGKPHKEVARQLGCPEGTVASRLSRGRRLLAGRLARRGITLAAGGLATALTRSTLAAPVPSALAASTAKAVAIVAAGPVASAVAVSINVISLAEEVLKAMSLTRWKITLVVVVLGAVIGGGTGWLQYQLRAQEPPGAQSAAGPAEELGDGRIGAVRALEGHTGRVTWVAFASDGRRAISSSHDRTIRIWDVGTGRELRLLSGHHDRIECAVFSPDGRRALSCAWDGTIRLWDVATGKQLKCFDAVGAPGVHIARMAFLPDGNRFLCCPLDHHSLQVRDAETGEVLKEFGRHQGHVNTVSLSRNGLQVLEASCDVRLPLRLWDLESGRLVREFKDHPEEVRGVALSPDGRLALSASVIDGPIRLWDVASGREVRQMPGHRRGVVALAFSPDGRYVLSGGIDQTVRLWHVGTGKELCRFFGHLDYIDCVTFSPDGRYALSSGNDNAIRLWRLPK
jgi:RNA polymerase sigma factor (sigma-70 family)